MVQAVIAIDTETWCFSPACMAPPVVCVSWACDTSYGLLHHTEAEPYLRELLTSDALVVGHNTAYDMACILSTWPHLTPLVWAKYDRGEISDTIVRQKLSDLARGRYRGFRTPAGFFVPLKYDLESVAYRHLKIKLDKNEWRLRYQELHDMPLEDWPEGARTYAIDDARATLGVYRAQAQQPVEHYVNEADQVRAAWWLQLVSVHGILVNAEALHDVEESAQTEISALEDILIDEHLVRRTKKGPVKTMAEVRERITLACKAAGQTPRLTKKGAICTDSDACLESGDPLLEAYVDYVSACKTLHADVEAYRQGTINPIHTRFESLAATGRTTSSKPNIQNIRWNIPEHCSACRSHKISKHVCQVCGGVAAPVPKVRECFVPRPGYVFAAADYDGLELRTLAQVCLRTVGYSVLAETLNAGKDPHLMLAATILGRPYDRCDKTDPDVNLARQTAKVANFGFPGGLGPDKLLLFARKAYRVTLNRQEAVQLKQMWLTTYPEFRDYFRFIDTLQDDAGLFTVRHLFSDRIRAGVFFCVAANSFFQGLGADASKRAGYLITRACYADPQSPLFGCRPVNYIHDEFHVEVPDDPARATAAAQELARLMQVGAQDYLPDVPATCSPYLMRRWSKSAKPIWKDGYLVPCQ